MSKQWYNPSRSAVVYDRANNRMIQPGERTSVAPHVQLVRQGKLLEVDSSDVCMKAEATEPIHITSALELVEDAPELELAEDVSEPYYGRKRKRR